MADAIIGTTGNVIDPDGIRAPRHYNVHKSGIEAIVVKRRLNSNLGDAFKYVFRRDDKGTPYKDLSKALWYLEDECQYGHKSARILFSNELGRDILSIAEKEPNVNAQGFYIALNALVAKYTAGIRGPESVMTCMDWVKALRAEYPI